MLRGLFRFSSTLTKAGYGSFTVFSPRVLDQGFAYMWTRHRKQSRIRLLVLPLFCVLALGYFAFHAFNGSYGLLAKEEYERELVEAQAIAAELALQVQELEKRTALLRDGSLERDIIDEQARRTLGLTRSNELVLLHSSN